MSARDRSDLARYSAFPGTLPEMAKRLGEMVRDLNLALKRRIPGYTKVVQRYAATGSTATKIPLTASDRPPVMVLLGRAVKVIDPSAVVAAVSTPNFYFENSAIGVFEPSGLVANTLYDLTFLVIEEG